MVSSKTQPVNVGTSQNLALSHCLSTSKSKYPRHRKHFKHNQMESLNDRARHGRVDNRIFVRAMATDTST